MLCRETYVPYAQSSFEIFLDGELCSFHPTIAPCHGNKFGARTQSQLVQNVRDVISNRLFANHQLFRNRSIAQAPRHQN